MLLLDSIPEMAGGWGNPLMQKEDEFLVLDGMYVDFTRVRTGTWLTCVIG